tara:strand:- start:30 stop:656 length:627 start_codon:yes stop_codon:yes gene_type:complete
MENVVHKIYHLTFPNGGDYVGSTSLTFNERYNCYRSDYKRSKSPICEISTQHRFKEVKMVEVDRIECPMHDSKIKMLEEEWKKKLNPTLNVRQAFQTKEEEKIRRKVYDNINKEYQKKRTQKYQDNNKEHIKACTLEYYNNNKEHHNKRSLEYSKTPKGKLNLKVNNAKTSIKHYTKQNKPDMVKKWEGILEERIQQRSQYRLANQSS